MEYLIGLVLAIAVAVFGIGIGFDRDRAFYPTVLIVVGSYYVLFGAMGASSRALVIEIAVCLGFLLIASIGYKKSMLLVAIGIVGHGVFDFFHHAIIDNPGVPHFWPGFCMTFDVIFGGVLAVRLLTRTRAAG